MVVSVCIHKCSYVCLHAGNVLSVCPATLQKLTNLSVAWLYVCTQGFTSSICGISCIVGPLHIDILLLVCCMRFSPVTRAAVQRSQWEVA